MWHDSILVSKIRSLQQSQGDSAPSPKIRFAISKIRYSPLTADSKIVAISTILDLRTDTGGPHHGATLLKLLRENCTGSSVHGLRASFRGWALAQPGVSWAAAELALSHALGSDTAQAYLRGDADLLDARRALMQEWADYATGASAR